MADWKALSKQAFLIDTEKFIEGITAGREPVSEEYRILVSDFNEYCTKQKLSARCVRKHLAELDAIRTVKSNGKIDYTCTVYEGTEKNATFRRFVCIYSDWKERIKGGGAN